MPLEKKLLQTWRKWQRLDLPVSNFRRRRLDAPTYRLEHDLDHQASDLYSLGSDIIGNKGYNYARRASQELDELERINAELNSCSLSESELDGFREYIETTRTLLEEILKTSISDSS